MKLTNHTQAVARCVLALAALGALGAQAGPIEDTDQAEVSRRAGDFVTAMHLLRKAADQNHAPAQARLADLLLVAEFNSEALALYMKAAQQGEPGGDFGLARMYADALGVPPDPAKALELYRKAEARNYAPAVDALARAYRAGSLGLPRDLDKARELDARAKMLFESAKAAK